MRAGLPKGDWASLECCAVQPSTQLTVTFCSSCNSSVQHSAVQVQEDDRGDQALDLQFNCCLLPFTEPSRSAALLSHPVNIWIHVEHAKVEGGRTGGGHPVGAVVSS